MGKLKEKQGATAIIVALMIAVFLGFAALAVDIGYVMVTKNELQNVADSAALAATRKLGTIYEPMSYAEQAAYVCDPGTLIDIAQSVALENKAAGVNIIVNSEDVTIGQWDYKTKTLTPTLNQPDAVRVIARRDDLANNPITTFFARIFGTNTVALSAGATAALTGESTIDKGKLIPVGISQQWFDKNFCGQPIKFYPTNSPEGCSGWNTFDHWPASESYLRKTILEGMASDPSTFTAPGAQKDDTFVFTGGTLGDQTFTAFLNLFNKMKGGDGDGDPNAWTTSVAVYESNSCSNPSGSIKILGFATAKITQVLPPPDKTIIAEVQCKYVNLSRGSGGNYGTKGSIPGLVE
jgi:Flp pilus assembly protein TadG